MFMYIFINLFLLVCNVVFCVIYVGVGIEILGCGLFSVNMMVVVE